MSNLYIALLHYPVLDKSGKESTSSITSLDIHDIARSARTYGVCKYFIVHPSEIQRKFVEKVVNHFVIGDGQRFNPDRGETLLIVEVLKSLEVVVNSIIELETERPYVVSTTAKHEENQISYDYLRRKISHESRPFLLLFGTSWGLSERVVQDSDFVLPPLQSQSALKFNHLSVRCASGIILDKVLGRN